MKRRNDNESAASIMYVGPYTLITTGKTQSSTVNLSKTICFRNTTNRGNAQKEATKENKSK